MTEREICESIVSDGGCRKINCDGIKYYGYIINEGTPCPLWDKCFIDEGKVESARQWLEDHEVHWSTIVDAPITKGKTLEELIHAFDV